MDAARTSMLDVLAFLEAELACGAAAIELDVLDPDEGRGRYAGETVFVADDARDRHGDAPAGASPLFHRPLRTWLDLAERLGLRLCTPRPATPPRVRLRFERLDRSTLVRGGEAGTEKYGTDTDFARIHKLEDPGFVIDMRDALERVVVARRAPALEGGIGDTQSRRGEPVGDIEPRRDEPVGDIEPRRDEPVGDIEPRRDEPVGVVTAPSGGSRVLYLGCNTGDEIALVRATCPALRDAAHVGVDHSASAITAARSRFAAAPAATFIEADVAALGAITPGLGRFDLIVSIGTLQSPGINDRELLRTLLQEHLAPHGAIILGVPNCRYVDGEIEFGARMKNFRQPELGLLVKDVAFYRKYLQQHHKQVFVTGKHYMLVTAVHAAGE